MLAAIKSTRLRPSSTMASYTLRFVFATQDSGSIAILKLVASRQTKLEFYDHPVTCPYCHVEVVFTSMMERIILARRTCPACKVEMLIEDGNAIRIPAEGNTKKPSGKIRRQAR